MTDAKPEKDSTADSVEVGRAGKICGLRPTWWLFACFLAGLLLRLGGVGWGSRYYNPDQFGLHADEHKIVKYVAGFPRSILRNHDYRYPTFNHHVFGAGWAVARVPLGIEMTRGKPLPGTTPFEAAQLFCRLCAVILGMLGVWATFLFARATFGLRAALWSAPVASAVPMANAYAGLALTDSSSAVGLIGVLAILASLDSGRWRFGAKSALALGLVFGAAVSAKYTAAIAAPAVLVIAGRAYWTKRISARELSVFLGVAGLAAMGAFALLVPGVWFDTQHFVRSVLYEFDDKARVPVGARMTVFQYIAESLTWHVSLAFVAALVWASIARRKLMVAVSGALVLVYLSVVFASFAHRYIVLIVPVVVAFVGFLLAEIEKLHGRRGAALAGGGVLCALAFSTHVLFQRYDQDVRYLASDWIRKNVPPGEVGNLNPKTPPWPYACPHMPEGYTAVPLSQAPEWLVLCSGAENKTAVSMARLRRRIKAGRGGEGAREQLDVERQEYSRAKGLRKTRRIGKHQYRQVAKFSDPMLSIDLFHSPVRIYQRVSNDKPRGKGSKSSRPKQPR